jgi:hypothetical protein
MLKLDNETTTKIYFEAVRIGGALLTKLPAARACTLDVFGYECLVKRSVDVDGWPKSATGFAVQILNEIEKVGA